MSRYKELSGRKFGRLKPIKVVGRDEVSRCVLWKCECECGNKSIVKSSNLLNGNTKSCGCLRKEKGKKLGKESFKHGKTDTRLYVVWRKMKERCLNSNCKDYKNYGGRGIGICDEWLEFMPFYKWAVKNGHQKHLTLDRINNEGDYKPNNCRFTTRKIQNNNRRDNRIIKFNGKKKTLSEWSDYTGINYKTLVSRLDQSEWSIEKTLTTPVRK